MHHSKNWPVILQQLFNGKNTMSSSHHNWLLLEPSPLHGNGSNELLAPHSPISSVRFKTTQIICSTLYYSPNIPHCSIYNCPECFAMVITICTNTTPASFSSPITPTSLTLLFPPLIPHTLELTTFIYLQKLKLHCYSDLNFKYFCITIILVL